MRRAGRVRDKAPPHGGKRGGEAAEIFAPGVRVLLRQLQLPGLVDGDPRRGGANKAVSVLCCPKKKKLEALVAVELWPDCGGTFSCV